MNTIATMLATTVASVLLVAAAAPAHAKQTPALGECVTLSDAHHASRAADNSQLLLKDGDAYYRVDFGSQCQAIARHSVVHLETNGHRNQLCPQGSQVRAKRDTCKVQSVEPIRQVEYQRNARWRR